MSLLDLYKPIRKFSYLMTAALLVWLLAYDLLSQQFNWMRLCLVIAAALILFGLWLKFRPGQSKVSSTEEVWQTIENGRPTFLNIYSNY